MLDLLALHSHRVFPSIGSEQDIPFECFNCPLLIDLLTTPESSDPCDSVGRRCSRIECLVINRLAMHGDKDASVTIQSLDMINPSCHIMV
jgi:hypothetical protein